MDTVFIEGIVATVAAIIVFCGSVFFLLAMVMGGRLAYFVTASITLAFLLIMGVVWSVNPLGPVGTLPEWDPVDIGAEGAQLAFGPTSEYPEGPWLAVDTEDEAQAAQASELESSAGDVLETAIDEGKVDTFEDAGDATANSDVTRLLEEGGDLYGAVTLEPTTDDLPGEPTVVVMRYDPGNPLGPARMITAGTFVLLVLHLFGLSASERKARESAQATV
ncbi:MAG: hypothetical protein ABR529_02845 [Actinomycetota bacterium]